MIGLDKIVLRRDDKVILSDVDFFVDLTDFVYIIGKVGSGKSSLLKALYGELPVEGESADVLGHDLRKLRVKQLPALRRRMGIIFQDFQLLHEMTVEQNLGFVLRATGWKKADRPQRIAEVLTLVGMYDKLHSFPHELSGGEQQRVCIARAILNKPELILADEPTANLDRDTSRQIMDILRSIRDQGSSVVMVTHNLDLLNEYPGVVYECKDGHVRLVTDEFYSKPNANHAPEPLSPDDIASDAAPLSSPDDGSDPAQPAPEAVEDRPAATNENSK